MSKSNLQRMNIRISKDLHELLKQSADTRGFSMNAMVIMALETFLAQQQVIDNLDPLLKAYKELHEKE